MTRPPQAARRPHESAGRGSQLLKSRAAIALAAVAGLLAGVVLLASCAGPKTNEQPLSSSQVKGSHAEEAGSVFNPTRDEGPLLFGKKVPVDQAEAEAGFHLLRPNHPQANDRNIRSIFIEQTRDDTGRPWAQVAVDYDSGLVMLLLPAWVDGLDKNPHKEYQEVVDTYPWGPYAKVTTVHGVPALVIERNPKGDAHLSLVIDGVKVSLFAEYAPLEASLLIAVAESLD